MTYRSNYNAFDKKNDYSNFAFKRSEILDVLRVLNSNFSFEQAEPIVQKNINLSQENSNQNSQYDYKFFLFKKPLLSLHEATCIMTGFDPQHVNRCRNDTNFNIDFANYLGAMDYINSCASARLLDYSEQYDEMNTSDLKKFLANENTFINGFNEKEINTSNDENLTENTNLKNTIANLELDVAIEKMNVRELNEEIVKLKTELSEKNIKIKEIELSHQKEDTSLLGLIFDETAQDRYAPDLAYAIKAWESIYIKNPKIDSHNNKANKWISKNTSYSGEQEDTATRRLREVIAPLSDWRHTRKKSN